MTGKYKRFWQVFGGVVGAVLVVCLSCEIFGPPAFGVFILLLMAAYLGLVAQHLGKW